MKIILLLQVIFSLTVVFFLGPFCINFILAHALHQTLPYFWALLLSFITGELTIPAAIIVKVLLLLNIIAG